MAQHLKFIILFAFSLSACHISAQSLRKLMERRSESLNQNGKRAHRETESLITTTKIIATIIYTA